MRFDELPWVDHPFSEGVLATFYAPDGRHISIAWNNYTHGKYTVSVTQPDFSPATSRAVTYKTLAQLKTFIHKMDPTAIKPLTVKPVEAAA